MRILEPEPREAAAFINTNRRRGLIAIFCICGGTYRGRAAAELPTAPYLVVIKPDGTLLVHGSEKAVAPKTPLKTKEDYSAPKTFSAPSSSRLMATGSRRQMATHANPSKPLRFTFEQAERNTGKISLTSLPH